MKVYEIASPLLTFAVSDPLEVKEKAPWDGNDDIW